ncbi:hypothetical protein CHS0354_005729 [Potamilus streckersoni]|uniref:Uncharacterized protein n=1 Tax=Potamilus streckersoni TaxID=2493646 RepID=A0AAE0RW22_9BIVA|nr:hypothetical protein CHS0354_005729 [Potamilus streckersoni]
MHILNASKLHIISFIIISYDIFGALSQKFHSQHACNTPDHCYSNIYSLSCPIREKVAIRSLDYGSKKDTILCPENRAACMDKSHCCTYTPGDCMRSFTTNDSFNVYTSCSQGQRCGWIYASSLDVKQSCVIREQSNYIRAQFECVNDDDFIDICSDITREGKSFHLHYTATGSKMESLETRRCTCVITTNNCNSTATLSFKAVDIRLHENNDITKCSPQARLDLIGHSDRKMLMCEKNTFIRGFQEMYRSMGSYIILHLSVRPQHYPSKFWVLAEASKPGVGIRVTCGEKSTETAKLCAPIIYPFDTVGEVPKREQDEPNVINLGPGDFQNDSRNNNVGGSNNSTAAGLGVIIGLSVAGVLALVSLFIIIWVCRKRHCNGIKAEVKTNGHSTIPIDEDFNLYEPIDDTTRKVPSCAPPQPPNRSVYNKSRDNNLSRREPSDPPLTENKNIYNKPWGDTSAILVNRAKPADLAYATSEEIKVLIEKMENDRMNLREGEDYKPDPKFYRNIRDYKFKLSESEDPENPDHFYEDLFDGNDSNTESKQGHSDHEVVEVVESEDSKVEADMGNEDEDFDNETNLSSNLRASLLEGYESPHSSSYYPSISSSSGRFSTFHPFIKSVSEVSPTLKGFPSGSSHSEEKVEQHSVLVKNDIDSDIPEEYAPTIQDLSQSHKNGIIQDDVFRGCELREMGPVVCNYSEPCDSIEDMTQVGVKGVNEVQGEGDGKEEENGRYCEVYDRKDKYVKTEVDKTPSTSDSDKQLKQEDVKFLNTTYQKDIEVIDALTKF